MSNYSKYHVPADTSFVINDGDTDLRPIRISLPKAPDQRLIDGYGLHPKEQKFRRIEIPHKLRRLEEDAKMVQRAESDKIKGYRITKFKLQKQFWDMLFARREDLQDEIEWIKKIWWHRLHGYWFFNKGKPTYITGWHFDYLNFWYIAEVKPDGKIQYRDRDRKEFLFHKYAHETTETFAKVDKNGWAVPEYDGTYKMKDLGRRVCYGLGQPKNRRSGNTNKGLSIVNSITNTTIGTDGGGVMSYTGDNAERHFSGKLVEAINKMPLFILPFSTSGFTPSVIKNNTPANEFEIRGLNNEITYAETAQSTFYDGKKLIVGLLDEEGKTVTTDIDDRWMVVKQTLSQGDGAIIHGYSYHPSTAEEYTAGGEAYRKMMNKSSFYQRKPNGQTQSGLFRIYVRSDEGLDNFIDSHGYSVKDKILPYQKEEGFTQTATSFILEDFEFLLNQDTPESLAEYRKKRKQFPMSWKDVWVGDSGEIGFPTELIVERINELRKQSMTLPGNFEWTNGFGSNVYWDANNEGRWETSKLFDDIANLRIRDFTWDPIDMEEKETWAPLHPHRGTIGADPFKFKKKQEVKRSSSKAGLSDGGIVAHWEYDEALDGDKPRSEWESDNVVCTYRYRAKTDDEYCEDVLKTCIWYGYMVYPEMNIEIVQKKFREWGYAGYLKYDIDPEGRMKSIPGTYLHKSSKQEGFNMARTFLQYRCHKINHLRLLEECRDIPTMEDLTNYDTLAGLMVALLGSRSQYAKILQRVTDSTIDISKLGGLFDEHIY